MFNPVLVVGTRSQLLESRKLRVISLLPFGFFFLYKDFYVGKGGGRERRRVAIKHFIPSFRDDRVLVDVLRILLHAQSGRKSFPQLLKRCYRNAAARFEAPGSRQLEVNGFF